MLGVQELLLALFISSVFALFLGSSRLVFAVSEIKWLRTERMRLEDSERTRQLDGERPEENPAREKYDEHLEDYRRGMRVCRAELVVGLALLLITILIAYATPPVDVAVAAGIVVAIVAIGALWLYVMTQEDAYL